MNYTILGGGIAGLSSAFYLASRQLGPSIRLFDAASSFNGWCRSSNFDGYCFESAPRTLRPKGLTGNTTLELIEMLGLEDRIVGIPSSRIAGKFKLSYHNKQIVSVTDEDDQRMKQLFSSQASDDESIYDFTVKKFDAGFADRVIVPMVKGICAGDARRISAKFLIKGKSTETFTPNRLYEKASAERQSFYGMKGGLEIIPNTIQEKLSNEENVSMHINSSCDRITFNPDGAQLVVSGRTTSTKHVISALPSASLARLVAHQHPKLAEDLKQMSTAVDVAMVNLHYASSDLIKQKGFGVFVQDDSPLVGIIFDSCCFDQNGTVLTAMLGGSSFEKFFGKNPDETTLRKTAVTQVKEVLGIEEAPDHFQVNVLPGSFPQYTVGHYQRVERIKDYIKANKLPISLCGQSFDGIGLNEVILSAKKAAFEIQL